jgi:hypothetical protein
VSEEEQLALRISIRPEPLPEELIAILKSLQPAEQALPEQTQTPSRWAQAARREQLRLPLDETRNEWGR